MNHRNPFKSLPLVGVALLAGGAWLALPAQAQRPLTTDRPDATESPYTVEPGRIQIEGSFASYSRDRHNPERDDVRVIVWNVAPVNLRLGLTRSSELQVVVDNYVHVELEQPSTGLRVREQGFGDVTLRFKHNLRGNDGGGPGLGIMPFVKLPTASGDLGNDSIEGGVIVPFATELSGGWGLGVMTELDLVRNEADDGYEAVWLNTVALGRDLTERWGGFVELALETGAGKPAATLNFGLTYSVDDDTQFDMGAFLGVTRAAPDLQLFAGLTRRF